MGNNIVPVIDPGHSTQHYRDQGTSGPGVTDAVLNYITRILIQVSRHAGTLYLSLKNALAPPFDLQSSIKKIAIEVSSVILCLSTAIMQPNFTVVVIKTLEIGFQLSCHAGTT